MRNGSSIAFGGVVSTLLAASGIQAQQAQNAVRPSEQIQVSPITASWSELLQVHASLPARPAQVDVDVFTTLEPPILEVGPGGGKVLRTGSTPGIEKIGPCSGFSVEPPIGAGFDSQLDVADSNGFSFIPPDVAGAVGPEHLMTMLNNLVLIQDRLGTTVSSVDLSAFWSPLGTTPLAPTTTYSRVFYDDVCSRWYASARNGTTSPVATSIFFAISRTNDPTGTWDFYSFAGDPAFVQFADWVLLGYNTTWITITANMFTGATFNGAKMWTIDKSTALSMGGPITVSIFPTGFMTTAHGSGGSSPHPARTLDGDPTLWLINDGFTSGGVFLLQLTRITGTGAAPMVSGLTGSPFGGTTSFCFVTHNFSGTQRTMAQLTETRFISPFSIRIASVAVRNGKIWVANSGGLPGPSTNASPTSNGVLWHQLDPTLPFPASSGAPGSMLVQSGQITNGVNTMSMYPSIVSNCADDVLVGYANGDATRHPRACYSIRLGTDALGFMGAINELKAGESTYWKNFGVGTTAQYGRYTSAAVDPNDDKTLWTIQEYADTRVGPLDNDSRWGTWWGRFGDCELLPEILDHPDSVNGCVGDPFSFSVSATSTSIPLTYQWRLNGVDILGATADTYSIPVSTPADAGVYDVIVCGCGQRISLPATLVYDEPLITTQPVDYVAAVGDAAGFFIVATPILGSLDYQWFHGVTPVGTNSALLVVGPVVPADYGDYTCIVSDDCGIVTSDVARLLPPSDNSKVKQAELSFHIFEDPKSTEGCVGDPVTLTVLAFPAGVTYSWRKNGTPIVPPETGSSLTINPVSVSDAGSYDVVVTFGSNSKTSGAAVLSVVEDPVITVQPSPASQTVSPGTDITYSVTATGVNLTYQWRKRPATPFSSFADIPGETSPTLELEDVDTSDAGSYRCVVRNQCGQVASDVVRLIIL